eukprot:116548_1
MDPKYDYSSDFYECKSSGSVSSDDRHRLRRVLVRLGLDDLFEVPDKFSCGREYRDRFLEAIRMERNCELLAKNRLSCRILKQHEDLANSGRWMTELQIGRNHRNVEPISLTADELQLGVNDVLTMLRQSDSGLEFHPENYEEICECRILRIDHKINICVENVIPGKKIPSLGEKSRIREKFDESSFIRMRSAVSRFCDNGCMSPELHDLILGKKTLPMPEIRGGQDLDLPAKFDEFLDEHQRSVIATALDQTLILIGGTPASGKSTVAAAIVQQLTARLSAPRDGSKRRVLVCAPSNSSVDRLALLLDSIGVKVVRISSRYRQRSVHSTDRISLHVLVKKEIERRNMDLAQRIDKKLSDISRQEQTEYSNLEKQCEFDILRECDVICGTCTVVGDRRLRHFKPFTHVLIDDSTHSFEPETVIPLICGAEYLVLMGDPNELKPFALVRALKRTLFERLENVGNPVLKLSTQYRMPKRISAFLSEEFYSGTIVDGNTKPEEPMTAFDRFWNARSPIILCDYPGHSKENHDEWKRSYLNYDEAGKVLEIALHMLDLGVNPNQIIILTPFVAQRLAILREFRAIRKQKKVPSIPIKNLDSFHGRDRDYIIFSCTRSSPEVSPGFFGSDHTRLVCLLSRAKRGLIIVANDMFMYGSQWNQLWDCSNFQKISFRRLFSGFEQLTDPERAQECKERGNKAFSAHHYDEAIAC